MRTLLPALLVTLLSMGCYAQTPEEPRFNVRAFDITGELPIARERALAVLAPYAGEAVALTRLQEAAKALEAELAASGYAFYRVIVPPQELESVVKLQVLPFKLANVTVSGNKHFSTENVLASLPALRKGESPNVSEVGRARAAANEHASKQVEVNFLQSTTPDAVDAEVRVQDEPPQRFFVGLNNYGDRRTGHWRASVGYQHSNLWGRDHSVTASYTTSPEKLSDVKQYGLYYRVPFYSVGGALTLFYAYSDVNSGTIANVFEVRGRGKFGGLHWRQHLVPRGAYSHALEIGLDDRQFENSVLFGAVQLGVDVRTRPVTLAYQGRFDLARSSYAGRIEYVHNLSGGSDNNDAAYLANRAGASLEWDAWRYRADAQWRIESWLLSARLNGQLSDKALISGEQFGLGGAASVRGLREREVTGDSGFVASVEAAVPLPWEGFSVVAFVDGGQIRLRGPATGQPQHQSASSVGVGLRWIVERRLSLSIDAAQVLDGTTQSESGDRRVHVSLVYRF